jgi:hypothetical protein
VNLYPGVWAADVEARVLPRRPFVGSRSLGGRLAVRSALKLHLRAGFETELPCQIARHGAVGFVDALLVVGPP